MEQLVISIYIQSDLYLPDIDYLDIDYLGFFFCPILFMNVNKLMLSQKLKAVKISGSLPKVCSKPKRGFYK